MSAATPPERPPSSPRPLVWVTRAEPGAARTAARFGAAGLEPLVAPVLETRLLDEPLALEGVAALAFTSAAGVRAFAAQSDRRDFSVFAVAEATAEAALGAGFTQVRTGPGDVAALAALIAAAPPPGPILHAAGADRAGDLEGDLRARGLAVRTVALYAADAVRALPPAVEAALTTGALAGVLIHSPRGGETVAGLLRGRPPTERARLRAFALSANCALPLRVAGLAAVHVAEAPSDAALVARAASALLAPR